MLVIGQVLLSVIIVVLFFLGNVTTLIYLVKYWPKFSAFVVAAAIVEAIVNGKTGIYAHAVTHHCCPWIMVMPYGYASEMSVTWATANPNLLFFSMFMLLYSSLSSIFSVRAGYIIVTELGRGLSGRRLFVV